MMYYPFVHPPRPVLWQALLYWDELTSIAPSDGYRDWGELKALQESGIYRPTYADDLPRSAYRALVDDLRRVVEDLPGKDLVPASERLEANNRLHWGKLPGEVERDLLDLNIAVPRDNMLLVSPVLLSQLMVVLAKHLAAVTSGMIPFTESPSAHDVAFAPLGQPDDSAWPAWQLQIGQFLPVPADNASVKEVLAFRDRYSSEREELAKAVRDLLYNLSFPGAEAQADPAQVRDPIEEAVRRIKDAVRQLEKAGHGRNIDFLKGSLIVLGLGAAGASVFAPPLLGAMLLALSSLGIGFAPTVTRTGVTSQYTYLKELSRLPGAAWPSPGPAT
jgi:hypothetical protein